MASRVISARLSTDNENEKRALAVFDEWKVQGYSPREIITRAILLTAEIPWTPEPSSVQLQGLIDQAQQLVEDLRNIEHSPIQPHEKQEKRLEVSSVFAANIAKTAKGGLRRED